MNYDFDFGISTSMEEQINEVIDICDKLDAKEKEMLFNFGENRDLVLHIYKNEEFDREKDANYSNMVTISTAQNGKWVDDIGNTYVTDGSLYRELERIWNYRDFTTFDIQKIIVEEKDKMDFKKGDRVFHKNLQLTGTFIEYDWTGKDEAWVEFDNEDGYEDCRHISTNQLVLVEKEFLNDDKSDKSDELDR